ncbi:MAG: peptidoglycan editing factor PgeF [Rickettsiales bacterium]|jgi:polyphenol oxidase|nr:peptidoglycan editing factor PgeF [Rickettsiales bacterium]
MLKTLKSSLFSQFPNIIHGTIFDEDLDKSIKSPVNFSYSVGDNPEIIDKNYQNFSKFINTKVENIKRVRQTHSTKVHKVDSQKMPNYTFEADSLITNIPNICLAITTADCLPILLYAKDKNYIANIHAGWRGAIGGIIENTIKELELLGCDISEVYAAIMPAIDGSSYEVDNDFCEEFILKSSQNNKFFRYLNKKKQLFDLKSYAKYILSKLSVNKVDILSYNSFNTDYLFSHRATTIKGREAGRNLNYIMIKND